VVPPALGPKQILVKIRAAPINPSDFLFTLGQYGFKHPVPTTPGFEGAGTVVQVGAEADKNLVGKNVAVWLDGVTNSGTWSDYFVTSQDN
jgi:NADPH:quinone reductase-like Zn-dependent oxidoreductase